MSILNLLILTHPSASFLTLFSGYFDDFVCLDRAVENPFGKNRMTHRMPHILDKTKKNFNRFLKKLSCEERLPIPEGSRR